MDSRLRCGYLNRGVVVTGSLREIRPIVRRNERTDRLAGGTGDQPSALLRGDNSRSYRIGDPQRENNDAKVIPNTHMPYALEPTRRRIAWVHEKQRCFISSATRAQ